MTPPAKHAFIGYLIALGAVILVCFSARFAFADGPPEEVLSNVQKIEDNQKILEQNREAHEAFVKAKDENEALEKKNLELGWRTNWATMKPVPNEPSFPQPL